MSIVPEPERVVSIGTEYVDTWPSHCPASCGNCVSCWLTGKVRCSPRFWLGGLYGFYFYWDRPVEQPVLEERRAKYDAFNRAVSLDCLAEDIHAVSLLAAQPLDEIPDGGFTAETTDRIMATRAKRQLPPRYTDIKCPQCGSWQVIPETFKPATGRTKHFCQSCNRYFTPREGSRYVQDVYGHKEHRELSVILRKEGLTVTQIASRIYDQFGVVVHHRTILKWVKDIPYTDQSKHNRGDTTAQRLRAIELRQQHYTIAAIAGKLRREYGDTFSVSTIYLWTKDVFPKKRIYRQPVASTA